MRTVEDESGRQYVLIKRSREATLVADPASGERQYLPNDAINHIDEGPARQGEALAELISEHGPVPVRTLLDATPLCESDLHGYLAELEAGGTIEQVTVAGERAYVPADQS